MKLFKSLLSITLIVLFFTNCKQKVDSESYVVKKDYFEDGKLKSVYFGDTLKIGKAYYFNNKGEKFTDINFYGSKFNGSYKYYFDGKIILIENYLHGNKHGVYINYNVNGDIIEEGEYKNNLKNGIWNHYSNNKLVLSEFYQNGKLKDIIYDEKRIH